MTTWLKFEGVLPICPADRLRLIGVLPPPGADPPLRFDGALDGGLLPALPAAAFPRTCLLDGPEVLLLKSDMKKYGSLRMRPGGGGAGGL